MKQLTLDAFLSYRFLSNLQYSSNGEDAAVVVHTCDKDNNNYRSTIHYYHNGTFKPLTTMGKERSFQWIDDTHILFSSIRTDEEKKRLSEQDVFTSFYVISTNGGEATKAFELPFACTKLKKISDHEWYCLGIIDARYPDLYKMSDDEKARIKKEMEENADYEELTEIPFYFNGEGFVGGQRTALFLYQDDTNEITRITKENEDVSFIVNHDDALYYVASPKCGKMEQGKEKVYRYSKKDRSITTLTKEGWTIEGLWKWGNDLLMAAYVPEPYEIHAESSFYVVNCTNGCMDLLAHNTHSLFNTTGSDCRFGGSCEAMVKNDMLYFIKTIGANANLYSLDTNGIVKEVFAQAGSIDDFTVSEDGHILIVGLYGTKLQEIYEVPSGQRISHFNDDVLEDTYLSDYHPITAISYGREIKGWVLLPKDYDSSKQYPAILNIHGGPRTVYSPIFYHEMQAWANEGYFVFFCNPTGSSGGGHEFANINGVYGTVDYENIMDFTDAVLEAYPQINKTKVGCTGGSYGGFMSNWILGHTQRFAAIATQRSISNWISFYGVSDIGYFFCKSQLNGDIFSEDGIQKMWTQSPLKYAKNMNTPTLIIHSNEDYRCPMEQGMQLFTALKEKGVPCKLIYFKGENHELSRSGKPLHRLRRLKEITNWMNQYVK